MMYQTLWFILVTGSPKPPILTPLKDTIFPRNNRGDIAILFMFMEHTPPGTAVYWEVPRPQAFKPENRFGRDQFFNTKTKLINGVQHEIHEGRAYMFLKNVTVRDSGKYRCRVVTPWGLTTTRTLNVFVGNACSVNRPFYVYSLLA